MKNGTPFANIAWTGASIIIALLLGGIVLLLTHNNEGGNAMIYTALGALGGTGVTTAVVHASGNVPTDEH